MSEEFSEYMVLEKYRSLIKIVEEHHQAPVIHHSKRHLGIILTLVGFVLYAFYTVFFQIEVFREEGVNIFYAGFLEFFIFNFFMFLLFFLLCLPKGKSYFKCRKPKLIIIRAIFASLCIWFYSLSRVWTSNVDNSLLYSTDALWVVLMLFLLGIKINKLTWLGVTIGAGGIVFIYLFDLSSIHDLMGGVFGSISGITLAIVILLTRYMVRRDPPLRIGLYHSLIGMALFGTATLITGFTYGWVIPGFEAMFMMMMSGFLFALTLFCFIEAFYYTESYIIAAVSFLLPVFTEMVNWQLTLNKITWPTVVGATITTTGAMMVIAAAYIEDRKKKMSPRLSQIEIPELIDPEEDEDI